MSKSLFPSIERSVIESFNLPLNTFGHELFILRDDLIHPLISGNKWRKLSHVISEAKKPGIDGIITYGGAFSNHLIATATATKLYQIPCILRVRGDELSADSNAYLKHCKSEGALLEFITREQYIKEKHTDSVVSYMNKRWLSVPEGGASELGLKGCLTLLTDEMDFDIIALAQGTTTTSLGVLLSSKPSTQVWVFPVLKGFQSEMEMDALARKFRRTEAWLAAKERLMCFDSYHFSGYAKQQEQLQQAVDDLQIEGNFNLDPVYTAKAFVGMITELQKIQKPKKVLFIHTGGVLPL
ncbi:MAG: 1-aminocyclopropane-1-carboxylate deaminase/D-cysteine desulfhydrase [Flavobacteriales bacterium]